MLSTFWQIVALADCRFELFGGLSFGEFSFGGLSYNHIYIINVLSQTWSRSCKHFVAKLGKAGIF